MKTAASGIFYSMPTHRLSIFHFNKSQLAVFSDAGSLLGKPEKLKFILKQCVVLARYSVSSL